ncbi:hypothetical protein KIN20_019723, partial [Parelaphostrongylus tenuis]
MELIRELDDDDSNELLWRYTKQIEDRVHQLTLSKSAFSLTAHAWYHGNVVISKEAKNRVETEDLYKMVIIDTSQPSDPVMNYAVDRETPVDVF